MKNLIILIAFIIGISAITSCSKETPIKDDIETGLLCDIEREVKYSEWCITNTLEYHIGYPDITCFDSMLISLPVINNLVSQYGNYPLRADFVFTTHFESLELYRLENYECTEGDESIRYNMFIEEQELLDPSEVDVLFYFYEPSGGLPIDSLIVEFKPWN